jgi:hypothetical protein
MPKENAQRFALAARGGVWTLLEMWKKLGFLSHLVLWAFLWVELQMPEKEEGGSAQTLETARASSTGDKMLDAAGDPRGRSSPLKLGCRSFLLASGASCGYPRY